MKEILHIYKRVSSQVQTEGTSLKTQEEIGINLAKQLGMDYEVHDEGGKSSANDDLTNRPVMLNLLRLMDKGVVKHLYVFNTDRLSRNQITWYTIRQKMVANRVTLYTPKGVHKTEDSMENMILGILSEVAQYDNKIRSERSRLGKFEKVKLNYWRGGDTPFGYMLEKDERGNKLQVNPNESHWIKFIFEEYVKRTPMKEIKAMLETNKVKTRRGNTEWTLGTLQMILRNDLYTGIDDYYDKKSKLTITNKVPVIITDKLFQSVKERRLNILNRKGQLNRSTKFYLLRDFMICGSCGTPIGGRIKEEKREQFYYCPLAERKFNDSKLKNKVCAMKRALNIPSADKEVWNVITHTLTNSSAIKDRFTSSTLLGSGLSSKQIVNYKTQCNNSLENFVMQKEQIEKALVKVEAANAMGEYVSNEVYSGTKKELITQYNNIKVKIESVSGELQQLGNQQEWLNWIDDFGNQLNTANKLTDPEKKRIINSVVKDILVDYDQEEKLHHLRINFRLPVMSSVEGILRANDVVLKRGNNSTKMVQTIENTGAPERPRSALFHSYRFC